MTRQLITIEVDEPVFSFRGYKAHGYALGAGLRPTFNGVRGAWVTDLKRLPDLVAYLERRHIAYEVTGGRCLSPGNTLEDRLPGPADELDEPFDFFGGVA